MPSATLLYPTVINRKYLSKCISYALALSSLSSINAYANQDATTNKQQYELEHIIVTAEKRHVDRLDIPVNVTAISNESLLDRNIESISELSQHTANLHIFSWGGRRDSNIFIRGIGPGLFTDPTVGFYVDGVNYSVNGMFDMDLVDIERIEVLRGPQGTLYGGNSLGGVINIVTKQPTNETEGRMSLSTDDLSRTKLNASYSQPLVEDKLFFGVALSALKADGHIDNTFLNEDFGARDDISLRTKLRWAVSDVLEANITIDYEKFRGDSYAMGPAAAIRANPDKVRHDFKGVDDRDVLGTALTLSWNLDNMDITSITSWRNWENNNSADQDAGNLMETRQIYHAMSKEEAEQITQELRFASKNTERLSWIGGFYAYSSEITSNSAGILDFTLVGGGGPYKNIFSADKDNSGYALFGQLDYALTNRLTATAGLRFDHEKRKATVDINNQTSGVVAVLSGDKDFHEVLPKIALSYDVNDGTLLYSSVSKGYRAGGFDTLYPNKANPTYDSESSTNYEIGYKTRLMDNRLEIITAAFLIDIKDQQVQQLLPSGTIITDNAGESRSQGIELETNFIPAEGWLISLSGNYTDATFEDYKGVNVATSMPEIYSGNRLPNAPKYTANLAIQNRHPISGSLTLFSRLDTQYVGSYYFDAPNQLEQKSYNLVNAKIGLESGYWSAYIWAKNALDEYYSKVEFNFGSGPTAEAADPRSVGITVSANF